MATDETALAALYSPLRRFAAVVADAHADPDDLVQEAFTRVFARGGLDGIDDPLAYLRRVVLNLAHNERRRSHAAQRALARHGASAESEPVAYPSDLGELLRLDARSRALLYLTELERASIAEAAEIVGCSQGAARMQLSRARRKLRDLLEREDDDDARTH
jgi:RNA polymerase sigma-70 factor, ECF subfamily